eukprot:gene16416-18051_t
MSEIINYFINVIAADAEARKDFKSLRESSYQLFKAGHVQELTVKVGYHCIIIASKCLPEMKKDVVYDLMMRLEEKTAKIQFLKCGCIAGQDPHASYKQVASLCYALEEFGHKFLGGDRGEKSRTEQLIMWNQPRNRKLSPKKFSEIDFAVARKEPRKKNHPLSYSIPSDSGSSDHCEKTAAEASPLENSLSESNLSTVRKWVLHKENLNVSERERMGIFEQTKSQSSCPLWFRVRKDRITGSICCCH